MPTTQSWEVSESLWSRVEPLLPRRNPRVGPKRKYRRRPGGGRKSIAPREIFAAIVYVLRTGCQWKALPKSFGSASAIPPLLSAVAAGGLLLAIVASGVGGVR